MSDKVFKTLVIKSLLAILNMLYWKCGGDSRQIIGEAIKDIEEEILISNKKE